MEIIVGKTAGFCYGVNRAVEGSKKILKESKEGQYILFRRNSTQQNSSR